jgi:hypothetical protein
MELNTKELVELSIAEIAAVTGAGDPLNNPPGIVSTFIFAADGIPDNNPPG